LFGKRPRLFWVKQNERANGIPGCMHTYRFLACVPIAFCVNWCFYCRRQVMCNQSHSAGTKLLVGSGLCTYYLRSVIIVASDNQIALEMLKNFVQKTEEVVL